MVQLLHSLYRLLACFRLVGKRGGGRHPRLFPGGLPSIQPASCVDLLQAQLLAEHLCVGFSACFKDADALGTCLAWVPQLETACVALAEAKALKRLAQAAVGSHTVDVNPSKATSVTIAMLVVEGLSGCTGLNASFVASVLNQFCVESFCSHLSLLLFNLAYSIAPNGHLVNQNVKDPTIVWVLGVIALLCVGRQLLCTWRQLFVLIRRNEV